MQIRIVSNPNTPSIIVVLACAPHENMAAWLGQRVVWRRSTRAKLGADSLGRFHGMRADGHARLTASKLAAAKAPTRSFRAGLSASRAQSPLCLRRRDQMRVKVSPPSSSKRLA